MKTIELLLGGQNASWDAERALPKPTNPIQSSPIQKPIQSSPIQNPTQSSLKRTNDNVSLLHFMSPPLVTWLSKKQSGCWPRLHWARRTGREGGAQPIGSAGWRQVAPWCNPVKSALCSQPSQPVEPGWEFLLLTSSCWIGRGTVQQMRKLERDFKRTQLAESFGFRSVWEKYFPIMEKLNYLLLR